MLEHRVGSISACQTTNQPTTQEGDRREQPTHITPIMSARGQTARAFTSAYIYLVFLKLQQSAVQVHPVRQGSQAVHHPAQS